jgi:hypothetical protein
VILGLTWTEDVSERGAEENFGPKRDEVTGDWRISRDEEMHPDVIEMTKSRKLVWAGRVVRVGQTRNACKILNGIS